MSKNVAARHETDRPWWETCGVPSPDTPRPACEDCRQRFSNEEDLRVHKKEQCWGPVMKYGCDDCNSTFRSSEELSKHMKRVHGLSTVQRRKKTTSYGIQRTLSKQLGTPRKRTLKLTSQPQLLTIAKRSQDIDYNHEAARRRQDAADFEEFIVRRDLKEALAGDR